MSILDLYQLNKMESRFALCKGECVPEADVPYYGSKCHKGPITLYPTCRADETWGGEEVQGSSPHPPTVVEYKWWIVMPSEYLRRAVKEFFIAGLESAEKELCNRDD